MKIEDILDQCLNLLAQGHRVEECLSRYPEHAEELEPLLRMAEASRKAFISTQPSPAARAAGRQAMLTALTARRERPRRFFPLRGWAMAAASLVLAMLLSTGTVLASFQSVPDETLYPVKQAVERVQLALATSPESRANTLVRHGSERLREIDALEKKGKQAQVQQLRVRLREQLETAADLAITVEQRGGDGSVVIAAMERDLARYRARLGEVKAAPQDVTALVAPQAEGPEDTPTPSPDAAQAPSPTAPLTSQPAPTATPTPSPTKAPPGQQLRPQRALPPQAVREIDKALDDYEEALERLKERVEQQRPKQQKDSKQKQPKQGAPRAPKHKER